MVVVGRSIRLLPQRSQRGNYKGKFSVRSVISVVEIRRWVGGRWSDNLLSIRLGSESLMRWNGAKRKDGAGRKEIPYTQCQSIPVIRGRFVDQTDAFQLSPVFMGVLLIESSELVCPRFSWAF